jgi:arginine deiminase
MHGGHGTDTEVGRLRTALVHRPGAELSRISPGNAAAFPFGRVPWLSRAQAEHDTFTAALRGQGVDVLYLTELLQDVLEYQPARDQVIAAVLDDDRAGPDRRGEDLRGQLRAHLGGLDPETLARVLITGLTRDEFRDGRGAVYQLLGPQDYLIEPLPGLMFTRDASVWVGDRVVVTTLSGPHRRREPSLVRAVYDHHPMFTGSKALYRPGPEALHGGDVLLLAPGVIAIGTGGQTGAAAVERLARSAFAAGFAHTVLAVPIGHLPGLAPAAAYGAVPGAAQWDAGRLDTICTMVGAGAVVMHAALAYSMTARTITVRRTSGPSAADEPGELRVSHPRPFLEAAALAMGIERLRVIDTGLSPAPAGGGGWDDGGNILVTGARRAVSFERHAATSTRLEEAGLEVTRVPGSELGSGRGGPRCLICPVSREPAGDPEERRAAAAEPGADSEAGPQAEIPAARTGGTSGPGVPIGAGV